MGGLGYDFFQAEAHSVAKVFTTPFLSAAEEISDDRSDGFLYFLWSWRAPIEGI